MDYLNETVRVGHSHREEEKIPVGMVKEYIFLSESDIAKLLYQRLNRNRNPNNWLDLNECREHAGEIYHNSVVYLTEMGIGNDIPIRWKIDDNKIHITGNVLIYDREAKRRHLITRDTDITRIYIFAGKGTNKPLRIAWLLAKYYQNNKDDWFHARARCFVDVDGNSIEGDLHWCEAFNVGAVLREIKRWFNMRKANESISFQTQRSAFLTEAGIVIEGGETIKEGKIVEIAKKASSLLNAHKDEEFMQLILGLEHDKALDDKSCRILLATHLPGCQTNILGEMAHIEYANTPIDD